MINESITSKIGSPLIDIMWPMSQPHYHVLFIFIEMKFIHFHSLVIFFYEVHDHMQ